jgi:hypothetical protein
LIALLLARSACAAVLMTYAGAKLVAPAARREQPWMPAWVSGRTARRVAVAAAIVEAALAFAIVLDPERAIVTVAVLAAFVVLTGYGVVSIRRTGDCGCAGGAVRTSDGRRLAARNIVLFGVAAAGVGFGPSLHDLATNASSSVTAIMIEPVALLLAMLALRLVALTLARRPARLAAAAFRRVPRAIEAIPRPTPH